jgi:hypothetical protein
VSTPSSSGPSLADCALLAVHGPVVGFFLWRYALKRRLASIGVALLPTGWLLLAVEGLGVARHADTLLARWLGVAFGVFLLTSVVREELRERGNGS